jgi:hypothetical protein
MKAAALALLLLAMGLGQAPAQSLVRVEIKQPQPVLVGEQVRVSVTVLAPNFFMSPVQFPLFDIPGTIVVLPDETARNSTETINGKTYAGIRRDYLITPQSAGEFMLPPAPIVFTYAAEPGKPGVRSQLTLPPRKFVAKPPPGAQGSSSALVARIEVKQATDSDPKNMKVGDALTRTIETFAPNTRAMMIPPPSFTAPHGVRVYLHDPVVADVTSDRNDFVGGRRIDRATYVFEQPGACVLPAIKIPWLNAESKRQEVAEAAEIDVTVVEAPPPPLDLAPPAPAASSSARIDWGRCVLWALVFGFIALVGLWVRRRFWPRMRDWIEARRQSRKASEAAAFALLNAACRSNDAAGAYHALSVWARRQGAKSINALCEGHASLRDNIATLERHLYARHLDAPWDGRGLIMSARDVRESRRALHRRLKRRTPALPALNPS